MKQTISSWESYGRSLMRMILAFTFSLHGYRHLFGLFAPSGARRGAIPLAFDALPAGFGAIEILAGLLLFLGLFSRMAAIVACCEMLGAYLFIALPRALWPSRAGGNETLIYFFVFLYVAVSGPGAWSLDQWRKRNSAVPVAVSGAAVGATSTRR
jgi:putative oxidoreductase